MYEYVRTYSKLCVREGQPGSMSEVPQGKHYAREEQQETNRQTDRQTFLPWKTAGGKVCHTPFLRTTTMTDTRMDRYVRMYRAMCDRRRNESKSNSMGLKKSPFLLLTDWGEGYLLAAFINNAAS